jgi:hypothetical protein
MFALGDRVSIMQPAALIPMAFTPEQERSVELFIQGPRWLQEARVAVVDSTAATVVDSMEEAEAAATVEDADLIVKEKCRAGREMRSAFLCLDSDTMAISRKPDRKQEGRQCSRVVPFCR